MINLKFRIFPKKSQISKAQEMFGIHCDLYNDCLEDKIKNRTRCFDLIKSKVPEFKKKSPNLNYSSLQQTVRRLDKAFNSFFKKNNHFPRFKKRLNSIEYSKPGDGWKIKDGHVYIQGLGDIRANFHKQFSNPQRLTLIKKGNDFFICLAVEEFKNFPKAKGEIGIDLGLKNFITTSDGTIIDHPKPLKQKLKAVKKLNRQIKSQNREDLKNKKRKALRKCYKKIAHRRSDFLHKTSHQIVSKNKKIFVEDLTIKNLHSDIRNINRTYGDVAIAEFIRMLSYKAERAGRIFVKVNPAYTSQECVCGKLIPKKLTQRIHRCDCGHVEDRDFLAAKNILRRGLASLH